MEKKLQYFTTMVLNRKVWKSVLGKHQLIIPDAIEDNNKHWISEQYTFTLTKDYFNEWNKLFKSENVEPCVPYTYYWPQQINFLMEKLLPDLGLSLRKSYHLGQETVHYNSYSVGKKYRAKFHLADLCALKRNRIMMVTQMIIEDNDGNKIFQSTDYTIVMDILPEDLATISSSTHLNNTRLLFMENGFSKRDPMFADVSKAKYRASYYCKDDLWLTFGLVAGAFSITHGIGIISRNLRGEEPFMQGMCSGNIALMLLTHKLGENLKRFNVYFNNKLYFPQNVEVRCDDTFFELFDEKGDMVVFGSRTKE